MLTTARLHVDIDATPELVAVDGQLRWRFPSGRTLPVARGGDGDGDDKKFTQADLDRLIAERLARVPKVPEDYEAVKAELARLQAQGQTEAEQLRTQLAAAQAQIATLTTERDTANSERDDARGGLAAERRRNAVINAAATANAINPNQVWQLLSDTEKNALTIGDDGQVTGADAAVKTLLEASPHLVGTRRIDPAQGHRTPDATSGKAAGLAAAQRRFGKRAASATTD